MHGGVYSTNDNDTIAYLIASSITAKSEPIAAVNKKKKLRCLKMKVVQVNPKTLKMGLNGFSVTFYENYGDS